MLNNILIPNDLRAQALQIHKTRALMKVVPEYIWHHALNQQPQISAMKKWTPEAIEELSFQYDELMDRRVIDGGWMYSSFCIAKSLSHDVHLLPSMQQSGTFILPLCRFQELGGVRSLQQSTYIH